MIAFPAAIMMLENEDERSFMERLYVQHRYLLFKVAHDIVKDPQVAEDMVSEACLLLIEKMNILRTVDESKVRAYIVSVVRNVSVDYVRRRDSRARRFFLTGDERDFDMPGQEEIDDELIRQAETDLLRQALRKVHKSERELLQMKYFELLSDAEIAEKMGIGKNSVRYYLTRARRSLRSILEQDFL